MIWWTGLAPWEFEFPFPHQQVALMDVKAKIMMLDDERILCFDECTIVQPPEPGAPGTS